MKKYIIVLPFLLLSCKRNNNEFLNYFPIVTKEQLQDDLVNPIDSKNNEIKDKIILNYFLIPSNSTENTYYYSTNIKNTYFFGYKYKIDKNRYIVSIRENHGHLTEYKQYIGIYNSKEDKIKSFLLIYSSDELKRISSKFNNNIIVIESIYKNNVDKGLDINPNIDNSIKITEKYIIEDYFARLPAPPNEHNENTLRDAPPNEHKESTLR